MWKYAIVGVAVLVVLLVVAVIVLANVAKKQTKKAREAMKIAETERKNAEWAKTKNQIMHEVFDDNKKKKNDVRGAGSGIDKFNSASSVMRDDKN